jgi:hypothetical protein
VDSTQLQNERSRLASVAQNGREDWRGSTQGDSNHLAWRRYVTVRSAIIPKLRGEGLDFAVMDEVAFMSEQVWLEAIRPALTDKQGKAMFISTPKGVIGSGACFSVD